MRWTWKMLLSVSTMIQIRKTQKNNYKLLILEEIKKNEKKANFFQRKFLKNVNLHSRLKFTLYFLSDFLI